MGDDAMQTRPQKKGCLSGGCGCLAVVILAFLAAGGSALWLLSRWDPAQKGWDRLPPGTVWAAQAHDCRRLLMAATRDPGAGALLRRLDEHIAREHGEDAGGLGDFLAAYESLGFLHTVVAPNSFVIGGTGTEDDAAFLLFRSPVWLRLLAALPWSGFDAIREEDDGRGGTVFYAARDGWMIVASARAAAELVLDGWEQGALPLGPGHEGGDAHIAFAMRREAAGRTPDAPPPEPPHFTLADPFAVPAAARPAAGTGGVFLRLALRPAEDGWRGEGHIGGNGDGGSDGLLPLAVAVRNACGDAEASAAPPEPYAAMASARLSPEAREMALRAILGGAAAQRGAESAPDDQGRRWLGRGWLENTGDAWTVLAAAPAVTEPGLPYPPLPVFSLGWTVRPEVNPAAAAEAFTDSLTRWIDAVRTAAGPSLLRNLRQSLSYTLNTSADAPGGDVRLPPVMVNAARPAWRFHLMSTPATGWLAADPAGIPDAMTPALLPAGELERPAAGHAAFVCGWDFRDGFIDSLFAVVRDRLANHGSLLGGGGEEAERFMRAAREALAAYPRGSMRGDCDAGGRRLLFRFAVPAGVDAMQP